MKLVACIMDLPYTINFRLTSLFLAVFTWEICSFIFVLSFDKQFHSYNLIWQGKSSSVNTGKAKKRTVVSQKSN